MGIVDSTVEYMELFNVEDSNTFTRSSGMGSVLSVLKT